MPQSNLKINNTDKEGGGYYDLAFVIFVIRKMTADTFLNFYFLIKMKKTQLKYLGIEPFSPTYFEKMSI